MTLLVKGDMRQTNRLLNTLKNYLKAKEMTYRELANRLHVSEATVKHLFSKESCSLHRLEEICEVLDITFYELAKMSQTENEKKGNLLSIEQENILSKEPKLLTIFYLLISGWTPNLIIEEFELAELECHKLMLRLDQIGLIELHPKNRFRLLVSKNVFWRKDGPLWNTYAKKILSEFLFSPFDTPSDRLVFLPGKLSDSSMRIIVRQIDNLIKQFLELAEMDAGIPTQERNSTGLAIGFRSWVFSVVSALKKKKNSP